MGFGSCWQKLSIAFCRNMMVRTNRVDNQSPGDRSVLRTISYGDPGDIKSHLFNKNSSFSTYTFVSDSSI